MTEIAIRVSHLSKRYRIGLAEARHDTIAGALVDWVRSPFNNLRRLRSLTRFAQNGEVSDDIIWALKDVSFEIERGEVVGIIGRNGAGKSTLLKILSRITHPTSGRVELEGRVSSLLEVGTGFHQELTGRENVYLNGTILGMTRGEIDRKFDEIVDFSGVEKFIDTPVKRYSSGMRVRLAFAVAAYLEPEILLVDEVLSVGDMEFQQKSIGKMQDVASSGRTVLFVSHSMAAVQSLCTHGILLKDGTAGPKEGVDSAIAGYIADIRDVSTSIPLDQRLDRQGGATFRFTGIDFLDGETRSPIQTLISGRSVLIKIAYECDPGAVLEGVTTSIGFQSQAGVFMFACQSEAVGKTYAIEPGRGALFCRVPKWPLNRGSYSFNLFARQGREVLDWVREAGVVSVEVGDYYRTGKVPSPERQGVFVDYNWEEE